MGCASSKPSKDKKSSSKNQQKLNKKSKSTDNVIQHSANDEGTAKFNQNETESNIRIEKTLIDQIKKNDIKVIEYLVPLVRRDLNNELTRNATPQSLDRSPDHAPTNQAALNQEDNDDLIIDVVSKAVNTLVNTPTPNTTLTYKSLNQSLKVWPFICKNQANKTRICDLTTETIKECMNTINHELDENAKFDLVKFLTQNSELTPPQTPEKQYSSLEDKWNEHAILMNRTKANQLARLLFLSNKARPVIHASNRVKDAYFVNRELSDKTQVCITQEEIDQLLNNSTYKNNPHLSPVTQRKLDLARDIIPRSETSPEVLLANTTNPETVEDSTVCLKVENESVVAAEVGNNNELDTTVEDITWANLTTAEDFEKREVVNLTTTSEEVTTLENKETVVTSCDTNVVEQSSEAMTNKDADFLKDIVDEINNLHASVSEDSRMVVETSETVTPPTTPIAEESTAEEGSVVVEEASVLEEKSNRDELSTTVDTETAVSETAEGVVVEETTDTVVEAEGNLDPSLKQDLIDDRFYNVDYKAGPPVNGDAAEHSAATTIQAGFKGEAVRQGQSE